MSIDTERQGHPEDGDDSVTAAIIAWSNALHTSEEYELDSKIVQAIEPQHLIISGRDSGGKSSESSPKSFVIFERYSRKPNGIRHNLVEHVFAETRSAIKRTRKKYESYIGNEEWVVRLIDYAIEPRKRSVVPVNGHHAPAINQTSSPEIGADQESQPNQDE